MTKLKGELEAAWAHAGDLDRELGEAMAELSYRTALEERRCDEGQEVMIRELHDQLEDARDEIHCKNWEVSQLQKYLELEVMRAKGSVRVELQGAHALELQTRDDWIQLLTTRVAELRKNWQPTKRMATLVSTLGYDRIYKSLECWGV